MAAMVYRMLVELAANAGRVPTYEHLLETVWGGKAGDLSPGRTIVGTLDDAGGSPAYIFTEPRVGYRMPRGRRREGNRPALPERERPYLIYRMHRGWGTWASCAPVSSRCVLGYEIAGDRHEALKYHLLKYV